MNKEKKSLSQKRDEKAKEDQEQKIKALQKDEEQMSDYGQNWEEFQEITKGNFNKLLGCG